MTANSLTALILAGQRASGDPLAGRGNGHKAFIEIEGATLIQRVLRAVYGISHISKLQIASAENLRPRFAEYLQDKPPGAFSEVGVSPATTILKALETAKDTDEFLITTSDHPLLSSAMIDNFLSQIDCDKTDVAAACVTRDVYEKAYPGTRRTFVKLRDFEFSGANIFWARAGTAKPLFQFWRALEDNRKNPAKMASAIGIGTALIYLAGRLTKGRAEAQIARKTGARATLIPLPFAEAAIDVDKPEDIDVVTSIIAQSQQNHG
ncbi:MAG: NTP transferase domain-containing protein [Marinicaulis sp.]|nr:nucleotidyltransferase family protein [Marinicaulis sp.]NNE41466.1 NTP transferase domain-containing protein [Marinicaulis sp.]NNL89709.1 NTP transferase domain-containing protein [Marinicaulis sp.]